MTTIVRNGNNIEVIATFPDNSVDSIVTDPPYELGFMGKSWDSSGIAYNVDLWRECLRVLKPGGHLLAFGGSRTYHRMACAIEDAGFQIRDQIMWVYGSGFPKSLNIGKAIDKQAGAERQVVGSYETHDIRNAGLMDKKGALTVTMTAPATPEAQQWEGWGTALKPAHEPIVMARKPLDGTVANNVLTHGVGGINIDGCRVQSDDKTKSEGHFRKGNVIGDERTPVAAGQFGDGAWVAGTDLSQGRFPANFIHDGSDEVLELFPDSKGGAFPSKRGQSVNTSFASGQETVGGFRAMGDSGSAARFFYCAKAGKTERNAGLDGLNNHPTVKPTTLMRYLVRLVTPPNGVVLDPFAGSGSTLVAATLEGFSSIGIEITEEYIPIIEARVEWAKNNTDQQMTLELNELPI